MKRKIFTSEALEKWRAKREQQRQSRIERRINAMRRQHAAAFGAATEIPADTLNQVYDELKNALKTDVSSRDIALDVMEYIKGKYGEDCFKDDICAGLWVAMQLLAGPTAAADAMRHFNFSDK